LLTFVAARFPHDAELAKDLAIQSLADATRKIRWYNPRKSPFAAWLYGVTRGQIRAELRRRRRLKSVPAHAVSSIDELSGAPDEHDAAEQAASHVDAQRQVALLSGVLSEVEFDVLVLNCVDQLSAREIGLVVGRSERAVHSLLHRARTKARERLMRDE
jgi:RNA polymerase sigma-70 factor (ECF subfamily)